MGFSQFDVSDESLCVHPCRAGLVIENSTCGSVFGESLGELTVCRIGCMWHKGGRLYKVCDVRNGAGEKTPGADEKRKHKHSAYNTRNARTERVANKKQMVVQCSFIRFARRNAMPCW